MPIERVPKIVVRHFVWVLMVCVVGCRSEEERARERAADATRACVETTRASKLPVVELPLWDFNEHWPVLRIRAQGLELDTRAALADRSDLLTYFGNGKPPVEPEQLDVLRPIGTDSWFLFPKLVAALKNYEDSITETSRVETTLVLDVAPDVPAAQVVAVLNHIKLLTVLAVRDRDGELSALSLESTWRVDIAREGCVVAQQRNTPECATPVVNLRASGAQVLGWRGLVDDECIGDHPSVGPFAFEGARCELPLTSTKALTALAKMVREVAAVAPGCTHVVMNVDLNARWSDVTPVLTALVATKEGPQRIALWGQAPELACPAEPVRPANWKFARDGGVR